ncbi:YkgJ family cysteine cluster protein [Alteromonas pelagimontana]|uniref:YkgJ family cysteine cluster protein n=1 Tax=Alteromonas pelagimontana TaxID=1858656 RepID=A0A6M4MH84_9ALTE|nr:YkgJ family cysteine cluster protein [Alteromonas pelagimontana]QJR82347.1 YkgJ family cysteine cluster protein [Alteromonas pelagimontana]
MNPCVQCGACCATFRVSFYWAESDPFLGGTVPEALTEKVNASCVAMKGTNQPQPRCVALVGNIGEDIRCEIYEQRSTTCREFEPGSVACLKARVKHGLSADLIPVVAA